MKFFPADKTDSPLQTFTSSFVEVCSRELRVFIEPSAKNHRESHSDVTTDHFIRTVQTEHRTA